MKPMVYTIPTLLPYNGSSICYEICQRGRMRAAGEPASVTDEKPALTSAGRSDLVD